MGPEVYSLDLDWHLPPEGFDENGRLWEEIEACCQGGVVAYRNCQLNTSRTSEFINVISLNRRYYARNNATCNRNLILRSKSGFKNMNIGMFLVHCCDLQQSSWESEVTQGLNGACATKTDIIATDCARNSGDSTDKRVYCTGAIRICALYPGCLQTMGPKYRHHNYSIE